MQRGFWDGNGSEFELIDTPGALKVAIPLTMCHDLFLGLNDSEGRDTEHIANIIETLKAGRFINTFLIVRNGNEQRMTKAYTDMLRIFELGFGVRRIQCDHVMIHSFFPRTTSGTTSSLLSRLRLIRTQSSRAGFGLRGSEESSRTQSRPR